MANKKIAGLSALATIAFVAIIGMVFAFKPASSTETSSKSELAKAQSLAWYVYQPSTFTESQVKNASNYSRVASAPGCEEFTNICAIQLPDNGPASNPTFTSAIQNHLWAVQEGSEAAGDDIKMKD